MGVKRTYLVSFFDEILGFAWPFSPSGGGWGEELFE